MADAKQRAFELMKELDYCMLTTQTKSGLKARPMSTIVDVDAGTLHILADATGQVDDDVQADSHVMMTFSNGSSKHVAAQATATVSRDRALIKALWTPGAQAFWPEGPEIAPVVAIVCRIETADYWVGSSGLVGAAKIATALATGSKPDMGERQHVTF